ncbi:unnamed protein product [Rangifer tarandus platyrhynchus]|uniref:Uncharacterized protein n=1 Tax=Rangifer tarandus platyrhynchus TaxID=3082113 RepID=A0ABN9A6K9_RANTA|nr:unnamed protein product [Rangifer tarandus platyrhynchus]
MRPLCAWPTLWSATGVDPVTPPSFRSRTVCYHHRKGEKLVAKARKRRVCVEPRPQQRARESLPAPAEHAPARPPQAAVCYHHRKGEKLVAKARKRRVCVEPRPQQRARESLPAPAEHAPARPPQAAVCYHHRKGEKLVAKARKRRVCVEPRPQQRARESLPAPAEHAPARPPQAGKAKASAGPRLSKKHSSDFLCTAKDQVEEMSESTEDQRCARSAPGPPCGQQLGGPGNTTLIQEPKWVWVLLEPMPLEPMPMPPMPPMLAFLPMPPLPPLFLPLPWILPPSIHSGCPHVALPGPLSPVAFL